MEKRKLDTAVIIGLTADLVIAISLILAVIFNSSAIVIIASILLLIKVGVRFFFNKFAEALLKGFLLVLVNGVFDGMTKKEERKEV